MENLLTVMLITFVMLALKSGSEASMIVSSRTKKFLPERKRPSESPYICLDPPIDLSPCSFFDESSYEEIPSRQRRTPAYEEVPNPIGYEKSSDDYRRYDRPMTIVYKIEGCLASRLPFDLPFCQQKDAIGRIVEVRRLFPFRVTSDSRKDTGIPLVFPELDMNEWHKLMNGPWTRPLKKIENTETPRVTNVAAPMRESMVEKLRKRKKFEPGDKNVAKSWKKYYDGFQFLDDSSVNVNGMNLKKTRRD